MMELKYFKLSNLLEKSLYIIYLLYKFILTIACHKECYYRISASGKLKVLDIVL